VGWLGAMGELFCIFAPDLQYLAINPAAQQSRFMEQ
jgi:hypothetical protein